MSRILGFLKALGNVVIPEPQVIVDFIFDNGLFYISIKNIGNDSAFKVSVEFDPKLHGVEGSVDVSELTLFKNIEFFPPQKEIVTFLDTSSSYFKRREPTSLTTKILYSNKRGKKYNTMISHNLDIYRDIGFLQREE
jgi:hypothetical protein